MPLEGTYEPGTWDFSNDQVERYESSGGTKGVMTSGKPCVVLWTRGRKSGAIRKGPVMRVKHRDQYAVVASKGGSSKNPEWYLNLLADSRVSLQDGPDLRDYIARPAGPEERAEWWTRATEVWPLYESYQAKTTREIPVVILDPIQND